MPLRGYRRRSVRWPVGRTGTLPELVTTSLVGLAVIFTATGYCNFAYQDPANPITVSLIDEFGISGLPAAANWLVVISTPQVPDAFFPMAQQLEHALRSIGTCANVMMRSRQGCCLPNKHLLASEMEIGGR